MITLKAQTPVQFIEIPVEFKTWAGGEEHVYVDHSDLTILRDQEVHRIWISAEIMDSTDLIRVLLLNDAILRSPLMGIQRCLEIQYIPYARQDRVCKPGEALSIGVFAKLINGCNFDQVTCVDPHSYVAPAVINNCFSLSQLEAVRLMAGKNENLAMVLTNATVVSPDAGATSKARAIAEAYSLPLMQCSKIRVDGAPAVVVNWGTDRPLFQSTNYLIVDDICDGGRTFQEIAKKLRVNTSGEISLFVSHGIFTGLDCLDKLFDAGIDKVFAFNDRRQLQSFTQYSNDKNVPF